MESDAVRTDQTVVVSDGRIVAVGSVGEVPVPVGAALIEAAGKYLLPGLAEMHGHVPGTDDAQYLAPRR